MAYGATSKPCEQEGIPRHQYFPSRFARLRLALLDYLSSSSGSGRQCKERSTRFQVVFWKINEYGKENKETGETENRKSILLRYFTVFNLEQCEGIKSPEPQQVIQPLDECEHIIHSMPNPPDFEQDSRAFYRPSNDSVGTPSRSAFDSIEAYYSTLFHELTHSTGHPSRVGREGIMEHNPFGSEDYSKEELVAEMGAAMLCGVAGVESRTLDNSASYLQSWINRLRSDSRLIVSAASQAQKAADYILARATGETESDTKGENETL